MPDGEERFEELAEAAPGPACRWWQATIRLAMPVTGYRFLMVGPAGHAWLNGSGVHRGAVTDRDDFRLVAGFDPPGWLADRVFYQVFPDRFANGDPANDVGDGAWTYRGHATPAARVGRPADRRAGRVRSSSSGAICPGSRPASTTWCGWASTRSTSTRCSTRARTMATTPSTTGTSRRTSAATPRWRRCARATRARDIRLILDIAPNHTGVEHPWFVDARADPATPTAGFYTFHDRPGRLRVVARGQVPAQARLPRPRRCARRCTGAADSILRRWLEPPYSIDGWRIDVANMLGRQGPVQLGPEVARGMRAAVKAANPDAYLMGEHFFDATDQLNGDQWDGVMNYAGFATPVLEWLGGGPGSLAGRVPIPHAVRPTAELVATLAAFRAAIPWAVAPLPVRPARQSRHAPDPHGAGR